MEKYKVTVVPLQVIFGMDSYRDGIDLTQDEFFTKLKAAKSLPTTSQPATADVEEAYTRLSKRPRCGQHYSRASVRAPA